MDASVRKIVEEAATSMSYERPSRDEAEAAVGVLLRWIGEDPTREGLIDTPRRVVKAYEEIFGGYGQEPADILTRTFDEVAGYDEMVLVRDIDFISHCEHHMVPIIGKAQKETTTPRSFCPLSRCGVRPALPAACDGRSHLRGRGSRGPHRRGGRTAARTRSRPVAPRKRPAGKETDGRSRPPFPPTWKTTTWRTLGSASARSRSRCFW